MESLCDVPQAMRPSTVASSAGIAPIKVERPPSAGAVGSAGPPEEPPPQPVEVPRVRKKPARALRAVGSAEAPEPAGGAVPNGSGAA